MFQVLFVINTHDITKSYTCNSPDPDPPAPVAPVQPDSPLAGLSGMSDHANLHVPIVPLVFDHISASPVENNTLDPEYQIFLSPTVRDDTNQLELIEDSDFLDLIQSMSDNHGGNFPDSANVVSQPPPEAPQPVVEFEDHLEGGNSVNGNGSWYLNLFYLPTC